MATLVRAQAVARLVLATAIDTQRQALLRGLTRAGKPKAKRVHELRVATRRLRVALDLATTTGHPPKPRTARRLKRLLDDLSPLRDAEVQLKALPPLAIKHPETEELGELLRARKRGLERRVARRLAKFEIDDLTRDIEQVIRALSEIPADSPQGDVLEAALAGELARRHLRVTRDWQAASAEDPRSLHRVRLSLKGYRYALDALLPILPGEARELSTRVAGLQDQLGAAHDAHVLAETAHESAKARGARHPRQLEALASDLEKTSRAAQQNSETALRSSRLEWPLPSRPSRQ